MSTILEKIPAHEMNNVDHELMWITAEEVIDEMLESGLFNESQMTVIVMARELLTIDRNYALARILLDVLHPLINSLNVGFEWNAAITQLMQDALLPIKSLDSYLAEIVMQDQARDKVIAKTSVCFSDVVKVSNS